MRAQSGFTLVELVVTLLIIGILAVAALPRFVDRTDFEGRRFHDQTLAALRYAQKSAVAQRRTVCVAFTATSLTLNIAAAAGEESCNANLQGPDGNSPYVIDAASGVSYADAGDNPLAPTDFTFNGLGNASLAQSFRVAGRPDAITIVAGTGYVY